MDNEEFIKKLSENGFNPVVMKDLGIVIFPQERHFRKCPVCGRYIEMLCIATNHDWLHTLEPVELVNWIKNEAAVMSDAELLKWMEEKHETD